MLVLLLSTTRRKLTGSTGAIKQLNLVLCITGHPVPTSLPTEENLLLSALQEDGPLPHRLLTYATSRLLRLRLW